MKNQDGIPVELDPRVQAEAAVLFNSMQRLAIAQETFTQMSYDNACELVKWHRAKCLKRGIPFPPMVVMPLTEQRVFEVVRADMDIRDVQVTILNLTVKYPDITAREIAWAIGKAFPQYVAELNPAAKRAS